MSTFCCSIHGCSHQDDASCVRDSAKMYLVRGYPNALACDSCYGRASGGDLPMRPYFDHAVDRDRDWDATGLIWGLGWIGDISFDELAARLRRPRLGW
jgi:hypothetical protein